MNNFKNQVSRVAIIDGYEYRYLLISISKSLKEIYDSHVCVYVQSEDAERELKPYLNTGYIDEIKKIPPWKDVSLQRIKPEAITDIFKKAVENEHRFNITYNKVRMTRRDIGLGFYLGAYYHPRSVMSEKPSYEQIVNAYNFIFDYWQKEFSNGNVTLVINGLKEEEVVAAAYGIPYRYLFCTRVQNYFHWTHNLYCEFPRVKHEYDQLSNDSFSPVQLKNQFFLDVTHKKRIFKTSAAKRFFSKTINLFKQTLYRILKQRKNRGYYFWSTLYFLWREFRDYKRLTYPRVTRLNDIRGKKFLYFPLATEPEMSLHWMSPECTSQLSVIHSVARDLPADTILVVKEAVYSIGKRSKEFYDHITRLKNTVLLDIKDHGLDVISESTAVVTISGTSGLEAAITGKPVILFGRHNYYDFLDHVFKVQKDEDIKPAIQAALSASINATKAKQDGARLQKAAINASFDLKDFTNIHRKKFDDEVINNIVAGLKESLIYSVDNNQLAREYDVEKQ